MEMQQIRYFIALGETLNFTQAAERCNVTQPSLTRAIQSLEAELGGELVRRERSLSHLTELGARMLPLMRQCYDTALAAKSLAQSVKKGETSPLSLAISWSLDLALFAPLFGELSRALRGLQLQLRRGSAAELARLLKAGEVELAIGGPLEETWDRLDAFPLFVEPFEIFASREHDLAGQNAVDAARLCDEQLLVQVDAEMGDDLNRRLQAAGIDAGSAAHRVATGHDLIALLEANLGIAVMPASMGRSERLCRLPLAGFDMTRPVAVYGVAGRRRSVAGNTLLTMLRSADWPSHGPAAPLPEAVRA